MAHGKAETQEGSHYRFVLGAITKICTRPNVNFTQLFNGDLDYLLWNMHTDKELENVVSIKFSET